MERLSNTEHSSGLSCRGLRIWGLMLALAGIVARGILQNRVLNLGDLSNDQLLALLDSTGDAMTVATVSLVLQILEPCAVPIFAWLLVTGVRHTENLKNYAVRVTLLAILCEPLYNLALGGKLFGYAPVNPVGGLVLAMIMLDFFRRYEGKSAKNIAIRVAVAAAAMVWAPMLRIEFGGSIVLITAVLWLTRSKPVLQNLCGAAAAMVCCVTNIFFMIAPLVFLAIYYCNGEKGEQNRVVNYLAYPVILLAVGLAGVFLF